jgi:hypothetical protein
VNQDREEFQEKLLGMDKATPALKEKYELAVQAMLEQKLTGARRLAWIGSGILGVGFVAVFGTAAVAAPRGFPVLGRAIFVAGAFFGLVWAAFCAWLVRRGRFDLRSHARAAAGVVWCFVVIVTTCSLLVSGKLPDKIAGVRMIAASLVFLVIAAVFMVMARIQTAELNTREKLLEVEYRLAELSEAMRRGEEP